MLILSRRIGEALYMGEDVKVTILAMTRYQVRIGIDAPKDLPIFREELYERLKAEQEMQLRDLWLPKNDK